MQTNPRYASRINKKNQVTLSAIYQEVKHVRNAGNCFDQFHIFMELKKQITISDTVQYKLEGNCYDLQSSLHFPFHAELIQWCEIQFHCLINFFKLFFKLRLIFVLLVLCEFCQPFERYLFICFFTSFYLISCNSYISYFVYLN